MNSLLLYDPPDPAFVSVTGFLGLDFVFTSLIVKTPTNVLLTITYRGVVFSFQRCAIQSELQVI